MLTPSEKRKAKRKLFELSDQNERAEIMLHEMEEVQDQFSLLHTALSGGATKKEINDLLVSMSSGLEKMRGAYVKGMKDFSESFKEHNEAFLKGIKEMHETLKKQSVASEINANAGPLYKTMINHLAGMEKSFSTWKYPQYSAVSVRNKNFNNINPAISPFGIEDYDEIDITYSGANPTVVVYKLNGLTMGTLTLTYSGSNITKVVRT